MNRILVTGGTGTVGRQVLSRLAATGAQVRALARNPGVASLPPQVEVVRGDHTRSETLDGCLDGIDTVFLVGAADARRRYRALAASRRSYSPDRRA